MQLLKGRETARELEAQLKERINKLKAEHGKVPKLVVVLVGNNPASLSYVKSKEKASARVGIEGVTLRLDENITEDALLDVIKELNNDDSVDGFIVQLPLPNHINENIVLNTIDPSKDVDGMSLINAGKLMNRIPGGFEPATPRGVMMLLEHYNIEIEGKHAVVVGRSNIVGAPMAKLLLNEGATITTCHRHTKDLKYHTKQADILIVATGIVNLVTKDMVKEGAVVVDVGINRVDGKIVGDVDFENVKEVASYITPVPGGVGPMTISALIHNVMNAFARKLK